MVGIVSKKGKRKGNTNIRSNDKWREINSQMYRSVNHIGLLKICRKNDFNFACVAHFHNCRGSLTMNLIYIQYSLFSQIQIIINFYFTKCHIQLILYLCLMHRKAARVLALSSMFLLSVPMYSSSTASTVAPPPFISTFQYRANNPIEDRIAVGEINVNGIDGWIVSVFDGHGGALTAEFAQNNINQIINARLKENLGLKLQTDKLMEKTITQAYNDLQNAYLNVFKQKVASEPIYRRMGCCALTAIILTKLNSVHVGNAGDCQGILLGKNWTMLNRRQNAGQKQEMQRLKKEFPGQDDIVRCIPNTNYCYVKGRLQPTRSFGDFHLKYKQYNFTNLTTFTGPYITHLPQIRHFPLKPDDKYIVLASDGLWDQLNGQEIHAVSKLKSAQPLTIELYLQSLKKITKRNSKTLQQLQSIVNRRDLHDDISIIAVDLTQMRKSLTK